MRYNPHVHHRRSIRLPTYDYAQAGAYFVTVSTRNRELLFVDRIAREIVSNAWRDLPRRFPFIRLDAFIVMPNHVHGILWIARPEQTVGAQHDTWPDDESQDTYVRNRDTHMPSNHAASQHPPFNHRRRPTTLRPEAPSA